MGIITSRDTRRISFDNTFALCNSALTVPNKSLKDENILRFEDITTDAAGELIFSDKTKYVDSTEEWEFDYWAQRIENLKREHQIINKIVETEFEKHIKTINKAYEPPKTITHERLLKVKPCFDCRSKIIQCYEDNHHQPLMCSAHVQAFAKCVASCRAGD